MAAASPITAKTDLAAYTIKVDGTLIPDTYAVVRIETTAEVNRIPRATVEVVDGDPATEDFVVSGRGVFAPGARLEIAFGYHESTGAVFAGIITGQSIRHTASGSTVTVEAHHQAVKLTLGRKSAAFVDQPDSTIVSTLLRAHGASVKVSGSGPNLPQLVQYYTTDWDFVISRCEANGWVVSVVADEIKVGAPGEGSAALDVSYGEDVLDFELELDALTQVAQVQCQAWSYSEQKVLSASSRSEKLNPVGKYDTAALAKAVGNDSWTFRAGVALEQRDLTTWANAEYARRAFAKLTGYVRFQGAKSVAPGALVSLTGFGKTFVGTAFVAGVQQRMEDGNWTTELRFGLDAGAFTARADVVAPMASGLVPGAHGLLNGIVKAINQDPGNNYRVQIEVPLLGDEHNLVWARLGSLYASNGVGAVFFPEIGDEVIVGFINADPTGAVVLGSVYSGSKHVPPMVPDQKNTTKGFVTQSKLELRFDESKPSITIKTPGGRQLILDDKDGSVVLEDNLGNSLKLSSSGIDVKTSKKLTLSADQGIVVTSSAGDVAINAQAGTAKAAAGKVQLTATATFEATGSMSAALQSDMETVVKGLMVKIN